jgi:hypothetical protein
MYHCTQNMNEIAAYLANASYVAALGGPPLADLKYGIIIVPAGEESLLFGPGSNFVMDQDFLDAVSDANRDYEKALQMHDPDEDSPEFLRHRFDDDFPSVSADAHKGVELNQTQQENVQEAKGVGEGVVSATKEEQRQPAKRHGRGTGAKRKSWNLEGDDVVSVKQARSGAKQTSGALKAPVSQQPRRSPRISSGSVNIASPQPATRTRRGKK